MGNRQKGQLPDYWKRPKLKEVATLSGRIGWKGLTAKEYTESGPLFLSVHSLNYGDYVDFRDAFHISQQRYDESPEIKLQTNDILICKDGAGIGKVSIVADLPGPTTINSSLLLIRADKVVEPKYLYYALLSPYFQRIVKSRLEGATTPHLYQRDIKEFPLRLAPLFEQRQIIAILDEAFVAIERATANTEKNLANVQELFESYLDGVFREKREEWVKTHLGLIGKVQTGNTPKTSEKENFGDYIPFIKPADFYPDGSLNYGNAGLSEIGLAKSRLIEPSSVLMVCIGATIGKTGFTDRNVTTNQQINALTPNSNVLPKFVYFQMLTGQFQKSVLQNSGQATLPIINKSKWSNLHLYLPRDLSEQKGLVGRLDKLFSLTQNLQVVYQEKLDALTQLKQSLLHKAFTGELTANQRVVEETLAEAGI